MKRTAKITSALLVLMLVLAQVVCVSAAAVSPLSVNISSKQTDHYEKTITVTVRGGTGSSKDVGIASITMACYKTKESSNIGDAEVASFGGSYNGTMSLKVRPNDVNYVKVIVADTNGLVRETWHTVGDNGYYNISSGSGSGSSSGTWDGIVSGGSSSGSSSSSSSGNGWTGYYDDDDDDDYYYGNLTKTYYVTCRSLNVRKGDGTSYSKVGSLSRGATVKVYDIDNGWAVIDYKGSLRYVSSKYLSR